MQLFNRHEFALISLGSFCLRVCLKTEKKTTNGELPTPTNAQLSLDEFFYFYLRSLIMSIAHDAESVVAAECNHQRSVCAVDFYYAIWILYSTIVYNIQCPSQRVKFCESKAIHVCLVANYVRGRSSQMHTVFLRAPRSKCIQTFARFRSPQSTASI